MSNIINSLWNLQRHGCGKEQGPCYNGLDWNWILESFFAGWNSTLFLHFQKRTVAYFSWNDSDIQKKLWNHTCQLEYILDGWSYKIYVVLSYFQSKSLLGKVFTTHIMNTHRIFHFNEYCFVNNAVEIAPPIINIIPIWPSNITDIVRNQCRDIVSTDYRYNLCRNVYCLLWFSRWHDDQI